MRKSAILSLSISVLCAAPRVTSGTTIDDFKQQTPATRERTTELAVQKIRDAYVAEGSDRRKVRCIEELFSPSNFTSVSKGADLVSDALTTFKGDPSRNHVEGIILGVIVQQCN